MFHIELLLKTHGAGLALSQHPCPVIGVDVGVQVFGMNGLGIGQAQHLAQWGVDENMLVGHVPVPDAVTHV